MNEEKLVELLKECRELLDDWCDEYGHDEFRVLRDKIDDAFNESDA